MFGLNGKHSRFMRLHGHILAGSTAKPSNAIAKNTLPIAPRVNKQHTPLVCLANALDPLRTKRVHKAQHLAVVAANHRVGRVVGVEHALDAKAVRQVCTHIGG